MNLPVKEGVEFRHIPGQPDFFAASSEGEIWKRYRNKPDGEWVVVPSYMYEGYLKVNLQHNNKPHTKRLHVLIAAAFHGEKLKGQQVRHLDDVPTNNVPSNLAYGTQRDQWDDRCRLGRHLVLRRKKLTSLHALLSVRLHELGISAEVISKLFEVSKSSLRTLRTGKHSKSKAKDLLVDTPTLLRLFIEKYKPTTRIPVYETAENLLAKIEATDGLTA